MATVLIVENTDLQAALIQSFIEHQHDIIGIASTSAEAVRIAATTSPDLVIMDLNLDDGTGIEATAEITAADPSISVIVSTVVVSEKRKEQAIAAGADAYLKKPYNRKTLLEVPPIRSCLPFSVSFHIVLPLFSSTSSTIPFFFIELRRCVVYAWRLRLEYCPNSVFVGSTWVRRRSRLIAPRIDDGAMIARHG